MAKQDLFYFENLAAAAECSVNAALYLEECVNNYDADTLHDMLEKMHEHEHQGDSKKHEMNEALAKAFVTPVDREDIALISQNIDEVTDAIEEVLQLFYMYGIKALTDDTRVFVAKIVECAKAMKACVNEFSSFRKPQKLLELIIALSDLEEDCDKLYIEHTMALNKQFDNALDIYNWRELYKHFEKCADACEHVGDTIELVVMKNN